MDHRTSGRISLTKALSRWFALLLNACGSGREGPASNSPSIGLGYFSLGAIALGDMTFIPPVRLRFQ